MKVAESQHHRSEILLEVRCCPSIKLLRRRTQFTEVGNLLLLSGHRFPRNRRFLVIAPKPEVIERYRLGVKCYVPPALSNGTLMRAIGLPVWAGHRQVCHFVFLFVRTDFAHAYRVQFLRYRNESLQAHCPRGGIVTSKKFGGRTPWGEFFTKIFFHILI